MRVAVVPVRSNARPAVGASLPAMDFLQHEEDDAGMNDEETALERELSQAGCLPAAAVRTPMRASRPGGMP